METNNDKLNAVWKQFESELKTCYSGVDVGEGKDEVLEMYFGKFFYNRPKEYKPITKNYAGYHRQHACAICKYWRMRLIDNVCEKHQCIVDALGVCDKFQRNF